MPVKLYQRVVHTTSLPSNLQLHFLSFCECSADYVRYLLLACKKHKPILSKHSKVFARKFALESFEFFDWHDLIFLARLQ